MCFFRKKKRRGSLPSTRNHGRDLDLELIGKTEEVVQVVEGDMSDVCRRERKCKTFMNGSEEDDVTITLFQTSAFRSVLILLTLVLIL